jgi:hypothetical protein
MRLTADLPPDLTATDMAPLKDALHGLGLRLVLQPDGSLHAYRVATGQALPAQRITRTRRTWPPGPEAA